MKRFVVLWVALIFTAACLIGCGEAVKQEPAKKTPPTQEQTKEAPPSAPQNLNLKVEQDKK